MIINFTLSAYFPAASSLFFILKCQNGDDTFTLSEMAFELSIHDDKDDEFE